MTHISDRQTNERTNAEHAKIPTTTSARHVKQQSMTKNFDRKLFFSNFYVNLFSNAFQSIEYDLLLYFSKFHRFARFFDEFRHTAMILCYARKSNHFYYWAKLGNFRKIGNSCLNYRMAAHAHKFLPLGGKMNED